MTYSAHEMVWKLVAKMEKQFYTRAEIAQVLGEVANEVGPDEDTDET